MRHTIFIVPQPCGCRAKLEVTQRGVDRYEVDMWVIDSCGERHQPHSEVRTDFPWDLADGGYLIYTEEDAPPIREVPKWAWSTRARRVVCWDRFEAVEITADMVRLWRAFPGETPNQFIERVTGETGASVVITNILHRPGYITVADAV